MEMITPVMFVFVTGIAGIAGFIDAVSGGGGILTLPAYMFVGIPPHNAYAVNKMAAVTGSVTAVVKYFKGGAVDIKIALISAAGSFIGSIAGAYIVLLLTDEILKILVFIAVPVVTAVVIFYKEDGKEKSQNYVITNKKVFLALGIGLVIGAYDAFIGSGVGTFAIIAFAGVMKYDFLTAGGNAKVINVASNTAALVTFTINGLMIWEIAIPCAAATVAGSYIGSRTALKNGTRIMRPMMIMVVALMMAKMIYDMIRG